MGTRKQIQKSIAEACQAIAPVMSVGWVFAVSVIVTTAIGVWLDRTFHMSPLFFIVGALCGIGLGVYNLMIIIRELNGKKKKKQ